MDFIGRTRRGDRVTTRTRPEGPRHGWTCTCGVTGTWVDDERTAELTARLHANHCRGRSTS